MSQTMRVSLPGYDALTDGTVDHYSVYADSDNILIKEKTRGSINIASSGSGTVAHGLGYVPLFFAYRTEGGTRVLISGGDISSSFSGYASVGTSNLFIKNNSGSATFNYFIFYDSGTAL